MNNFSNFLFFLSPSFQAVRLESAYTQVTRYMVVVSTNGRQDTEESIVLGVDFVSSDRSVPTATANRYVCSVMTTAQQGLPLQ